MVPVNAPAFDEYMALTVNRASGAHALKSMVTVPLADDPVATADATLAGNTVEIIGVQAAPDVCASVKLEITTLFAGPDPEFETVNVQVRALAGPTLLVINPDSAGVTAGPVETIKFTADPAATWLPATGVELITLPVGTVLLAAVATVPSTKPALTIAVVAAACVNPTTFGTAT
jgi:hypothetical protein